MLPLSYSKKRNRFFLFNFLVLNLIAVTYNSYISRICELFTYLIYLVIYNSLYILTICLFMRRR